MTGKVVIPECMEEIRDRLFSGNKGITAVVIPGTVKKIGELAFSNCENLEEVLLEEGIEEIGRNAFSGTKIRSLTYPDSIRVYNGQAFQGLRLDAPVTNVSKTILVGVTGNLTGESYSVPDGIKSIGPDAFFLQKDLKEIRFPDSLRRIQGRAFVDC
ncbi:MAG: leucine-rich repeat domain-containing protein, partial [Clostridia bacterium]|nr:leucine-rich repeat domain-containing protein [Clostridia bacterium]